MAVVPRIGVVSDTPLQLFAIQSALRDAGYEIVIACAPDRLSASLLLQTHADAWVVSTFGDWAGLIHLGAFLVKLVAFILFFILIRWTVPRFRYDQLMKLGWVVFFELALINILIAALIMTYTRGNLSTPAFIGAFIGVIVFSGVMFYIAKSLDRMLASDTKKGAQS